MDPKIKYPLQDYPYKIILGSKSPRRYQFLKELKIDFECREVHFEEYYPKNKPLNTIPVYLAIQKSEILFDTLSSNELLMTFDTTVIANHGTELLEKPKNKIEAQRMLQILSDAKHEVITGVSLRTRDKHLFFDCTTTVYFKKLWMIEIQYYLDFFEYLDKAGSYGIQDWIGHIGVEKIEGSYTNVMGFPSHLVYSKLLSFIV